MEALFFWIFALGLIAFSVAVVLNRNPVANAMCLVAAFIFLAALFVLLEAFFLAAVQIIVYAGAVMVLFLFIIMLLDIKEEAKRPLPWVRIGIVSVLSICFFVIFIQVLGAIPGGNTVLEWGWGTSKMPDAAQLGKSLFTKYLLPFEATAVLLLVATLGVVLLSKKEVE